MFNKNLKYYRLKKNMSKKELASLIGVTPMANCTPEVSGASSANTGAPADKIAATHIESIAI